LKFFEQTLTENFQSNLDFKNTIAIMIAIEKSIRINQTVSEKCSVTFERRFSGLSH